MKITSITCLVFALLIGCSALLDSVVAYSVQHGSEIIRHTGSALAWVGNSGWMGVLLLIISSSAILVSNTANSPITRKKAKLVLSLCIVIFLIIIVSGAFAQVFKHLIGRGRPVHFSDFGAFYFKPLSFERSYHSFPSGHATTIAALMVVWLRFIPKLWYVFFLLILIGGGARVAGGSHYPSDVVAGWFLGCATSYILIQIFIAKGVIPSFDSPKWHSIGRRFIKNFRTAFDNLTLDTSVSDLHLLKNTIVLLLIMITSLIAFISYPQIDLKISAVFFDDTHGFWLASDASLSFIRNIFTLSVLFTFLSSIFMIYISARVANVMQIHSAVWGYIASAFIIGPGLVSNLLFKTHWGRARPASIEQFGGDSQYTFPFELAQECERNCSFVSGEGSAVAMLALVIASLFWKKLRKSPMLLCSLTGLTIFGICLRIVKGRHFFSDSIFAFLIMGLVLLVLYRLFSIDRHRCTISWNGLRQDVQKSIQYIIAPRSDKLSLRCDLYELFRAVCLIVPNITQILKILSRANRQIKTKYRDIELHNENS